ncbi:MAG: hypothetical protein KDD26_02325 [Winogradskyella sp.]|nr:hypothetical protein [Winogradskyella sp.]
MRIFVFTLFLSILLGCKSKEPKVLPIDSKNYNYKYGHKYAKNRLSYSGKINSERLKELRSFIFSISSDFDINQTLLINFKNDGSYCISANPKYISNIPKSLQNIYNMSNKFAVKYNIQHLCSFSKSSPFFEYLSENSNWVIDNGTIENIFFRSNQICSGFVIIEPDGSFLCHFGEDYFSEISNYLKKR